MTCGGRMKLHRYMHKIYCNININVLLMFMLLLFGIVEMFGQIGFDGLAVLFSISKAF